MMYSQLMVDLLSLIIFSGPQFQNLDLHVNGNYIKNQKSKTKRPFKPFKLDLEAKMSVRDRDRYTQKSKTSQL